MTNMIGYKSMKTEKIEQLRKVIEILKGEFVGIDSIIEELYTAICPWYITPEVVKRPQVISLWGMTGTGKTTLVKRLIELLDLTSQTLFFDCGEDGEGRDKGVTEKVNLYLGDDDDNNFSEEIGKRLVFVFDEFQYARTIDKSGEEISKSGLRSIWNLIDSGVINLTSNGWDTTTYTNFLDDLQGFSNLYPNIKISNCMVEDPNDVKIVLDNLGLLYFDRGVPGFMKPTRSYRKVVDDENDDPYRPLRIIEDDIFRILRRRVVSKKGLDFFNNILKKIAEPTNLNEIVQILQNLRQYVVAPKYIECSDSLIFILGNLDEAYSDSKDINPDIDADMFLDSTSHVSINDIKEALKKRFRPEQISRFGNNIIKYPSLSSSCFKTIIELECNRLCTEFQDNFGIYVHVDEDFKNLLYSEGVYPVQGVRPVLTTIGTLLTPIFSKILIFLESKENKSDYKINITLGGQTDFKKPEIKAFIEFSEMMKESVTLKLQLGAERNPNSRKTRVINSVHESGHAIVMAYLTGTVPLQVVSVSIDHGGFCLTYDKEKESEIKSRQDIANNVCISLAGYEAEKLVFGNSPEKLLCGSNSDIENAWNILSSEVYRGGYFDPYCYTSLISEHTSDGLPSGFADIDVTRKLEKEFEKLDEMTKKILNENRELIVKMSSLLSETGSLNQSQIEELINKNQTGTLNSERLEFAKQDNSYAWYEEKLREFSIK